MTGGWRTILREDNAKAGAILVACVSAFFLTSLVFTPYDPMAISLADRLSTPVLAHPMGTDEFGRDMLSRIMSAGVITLRVSLMVTVIAIAAGAFVGAAAGYFGGWIDRAINILVDAILTIPGLLLALAIMFVLGPGEFGVLLALGIAFTPTVARIIRSRAVSLRSMEFVKAARLHGRGHVSIILFHIIPNTLSQLTILGSAIFVQAVLAESALSFLGLGVPPPYPTLGGMLSDARGFIQTAPWLSVFPGLALVLLLIGANLIGDALRDKFDPRTISGGPN